MVEDIRTVVVEDVKIDGFTKNEDFNNLISEFDSIKKSCL
jgi:hypothetical protein